MQAIPLLKREKIWMLTLLITPFSMIVIFHLLGGMELQAIVGSLAVFAFHGGFVSLPQRMVKDKITNFQSYFVSAPISPLLYNLSFSIAMLLPQLIPILLMLVLMLVIGVQVDLVGIWQIGLIMLGTWIVGSLLGFSIGTHVSRVIHISAIANTGALLLEMLPPVYYPLILLPKGLQKVVLFVPTVAPASLIRSTLGMINLTELELLLAVTSLTLWIILPSLFLRNWITWEEK